MAAGFRGVCRFRGPDPCGARELHAPVLRGAFSLRVPSPRVFPGFPFLLLAKLSCLPLLFFALLAHLAFAFFITFLCLALPVFPLLPCFVALFLVMGVGFLVPLLAVLVIGIALRRLAEQEHTRHCESGGGQSAEWYVPVNSFCLPLSERAATDVTFLLRV